MDRKCDHCLVSYIWPIGWIIYHLFNLSSLDASSPQIRSTASNPSLLETVRNFINVFISFFKKPKMGIVIIFILLYRFGEAQLVKIAPLFMLDPIEAGGLGLTTIELGFASGTIGTIMLTIGGIMGGFLQLNMG